PMASYSEWISRAELSSDNDRHLLMRRLDRRFDWCWSRGAGCSRLNCQYWMRGWLQMSVKLKASDLARCDWEYAELGRLRADVEAASLLVVWRCPFGLGSMSLKTHIRQFLGLSRTICTMQAVFRGVQNLGGDLLDSAEKLNVHTWDDLTGRHL